MYIQYTPQSMVFIIIIEVNYLFYIYLFIHIRVVCNLCICFSCFRPATLFVGMMLNFVFLHLTHHSEIMLSVVSLYVYSINYKSGSSFLDSGYRTIVLVPYLIVCKDLCCGNDTVVLD